ncbi:MAG: hypothetical protein WD875_03150 [Pirellulales bacterium]
MSQHKPLKVHAKALIGCSLLIVAAVGFSWACPFVFVECTRTGQQVDCVVEQRMLALIPFASTTIRGLDKADIVLEPGTGTGNRRTTDTYFLVLTDRHGNATRFMLDSMQNPTAAHHEPIVAGINDFIALTDERHSDWTAPLLAYAPFLPAILGAIFLSLVAWDFVATHLRKTSAAS